MSEDEQAAESWSCTVCGSAEYCIITSRDEMASELKAVQQFHRQRRKSNHRQDQTDRTTFSQDQLTNIIECAACGLLCRYPRPSLGDISQAYTSESYTEAYLEAEFIRQRRWAKQKIQRVQASIRESPTPAVMVEVGSFVGGFLAAGQEQGWRMHGVDPGKRVGDFCRRKHLSVFQGTMSEVPLATESVNGVFIWNTFDQLPNPDTTLGAAHRLLTPGGLLVIRIPNGRMYRHAKTLLSHNTGWRSWIIAALIWNNLFSFPYLYGYSVRTVDLLVSRHGFRRKAFSSDTLVPLSDAATTWRGAWEERLVKWSCRQLAALETYFYADRVRWSPWVDLYYERIDEVAPTPTTVPRSPPCR
jgi:hypothetical protein